MEVLVGAQDDDIRLRDFMETHFEIVPIDMSVSEIAVQLRRSRHLRLPDAIILATAQSQAALLVTRNTKDFNPEWEGIQVPYSL
jgi:predicted nucleic acid-binding protein